ncbi:MAG: asparagine synthase (glutamine-hydrolyzing) [Lentisphaerae bacterium RIFOXYB12_FULL_65_16]|nr:MAG: asparagine synthase (glutamine-hydrolyzing) [Lentisphaerae bacterium RIFOXYA12_64_32]OGV85578.1 MAG: asparagine synthase (glutamine-hydrolyzing) [Lentisphaerae bacterium RIFOXYB12_FULL_65_16]
MCGIAGYIDTAEDRSTLAEMLRALAHRGPDGQGVWHSRFDSWHVAFGHRRLAIIDLDGGVQPMAGENGRCTITFNGEVYNFRELRRELEARGHAFTTRSDTESVIHHFEEHGVSGLPDLNGMFAFAIWDQAKGELVLARDRAGVKPLYYAALPGGGIVFASELRALLQHPRVSRRVSPEGLQAYFFSDYALPPLSLVEGVSKLPPAHYVRWRVGGPPEEPRPYWSLRDIPALEKPGNDRALASSLWQRLGDAVKAQMVSDVPLGVFLSGGIDSSTVACLAQAATSERLRTFSIGFDVKGFDESPYARLVARQIGSEHIEERLSEANLLDVLDDALDCLDEPIADPSIVPTFLLSRLAARHVKVVLGGDGGDEVWGGYPTYKAHRYAAVYRRVPEVLRRWLVEPLIRSLPVMGGYMPLDLKAKRFALRWDDDPQRRHLRWLANTDLADLRLALPRMAALQPAILDLPPALVQSDAVNRVLALDFTTYMHASVLTKVDRASMAHGLEVRPPLLDNGLVEWAFSLPGHTKVRGLRTKHLLKLAVRGHLPRAIVERPKQGFGIPLAAWLRGPLRARLQEVLDNSPVWDNGWLARDVFAAWFDQHLVRKADRSKSLWALLVLDRWARRDGIQPFSV